MINLHLVDDGQVELIENNGLGDVGGERGMAFDDRHGTPPPALICWREFLGAAQRKRRNEVHRERGCVVVIDDDCDVGLCARHPFLGLFKAREDPFPVGFLGLPLSSAAPMAGTCDEPTPAMIFAMGHFRFAGALDLDFAVLLSLASLSWPDLLRLPSTERPPASIILA